MKFKALNAGNVRAECVSLTGFVYEFVMMKAPLLLAVTQLFLGGNRQNSIVRTFFAC